MSLTFSATAYAVDGKRLSKLESYACESPDTALELGDLEDLGVPKGITLKWARGLSHDREPTLKQCHDPHLVLKSLQWVAGELAAGDDDDAADDVAEDIEHLIRLCKLAIDRGAVMAFRFL